MKVAYYTGGPGDGRWWTLRPVETVEQARHAAASIETMGFAAVVLENGINADGKVPPWWWDFADAKRSVGAPGDDPVCAVVLGSTPNSDFPLGQQGPAIEPHWVPAHDVGHARRLCIRFIAANDLGGGNWIGGRVYERGELVGRVRYNGSFGPDDRPEHVLDRYGAR